MSLLLIFVLATIVLLALFWGGGLVAQGYLYSEPAEHMPVRALVAALLLGGFFTSWASLERKHPGKYGSPFEFTTYDLRECDEFEAVRWQAVPGKSELKKDAAGKPEEAIVKYHRTPGNRNAPFIGPDGKPFQLQVGGKMTVALIEPMGENGRTIRFDAKLKDEARTGMPVYANNVKLFEEVGGNRTIDGNQPGTVFVPDTKRAAIALTLNLFHFVLWFGVFWLVLRFSAGHAVGFAALFGLVTMLLVMPMLFKPAPAVEPPRAVTGRVPESSRIAS